MQIKRSLASFPDRPLAARLSRMLATWFICGVFVTACSDLVGANFDPESPAPDAGQTSSIPSEPLDEGKDTCAGEKKVCSEECVRKDNPAFGCAAGDCTPCSLPYAEPACASGACSIGSCRDKRADCNGAVTDGCEVRVDIDPDNCGTCGVACAAGQVCAPSGCQSSCPSNASQCGRSCVDLRRDENHCGSCGHACPSPSNGAARCQDGQCSAECNAGFHLCGGTCVAENASSCGPACMACPSSPNGRATCNAGRCEIQCDAAYQACSSGCCPAAAPCNASTCPDGCCDGNACRPGHSVNACGSGGGACTACTGACSAGRCRPQMVLLYGGGGVEGDAWEWDGAAWYARTVQPNPGIRAFAAMASTGDKIVLVGGAFTLTTWIWNGSTWSSPTQSFGPTFLRSHAMSKLENRIILFGGETGGYNSGWGGYLWSTYGSDATYEWSGLAWSQPSVAGPPALDGHAMAETANRVVLFGGTRSFPRAMTDETWEWDGSTWTRRTVSMHPSPRRGHAMASIGSKVVLFGGENASGAELADTWEWSGTAWSQRNVQGPSARHAHAMAALGNKIVLFGGTDDTNTFDDTWEWDGTTWTERTVQPHPSARKGHAMASYVKP